MRVISGEKKGKKLLQSKNKNTRPLKDLTKESLFNILKHTKRSKIEIENSKILDLFSGFGSFGIECLSRGANKVVFFENFKPTAVILKKNIDNFGYQNKTQIFELDIYRTGSLNVIKDKFNIIFIDLPFKENRVLSLINKIKNLNILKKNGLIILHRHKKAQDIFPGNFKIVFQKIYGKSKLIFGNI